MCLKRPTLEMSECTVAADVGSHGGDGQVGGHEGKLKNEAAHVVY